MNTIVVLLLILISILSIILVYSINKLQNSASLTTPASTSVAPTTWASLTTPASTTVARTTLASTTAARTTPASTTVASTTAARTTPTSTTVAPTTWASLTTPASATAARITPAPAPAVLLKKGETCTADAECEGYDPNDTNTESKQFRCRNLNTLEDPVRQCNNWGGGVHVCNHVRGGKQYHSNAFGYDHCAAPAVLLKKDETCTADAECEGYDPNDTNTESRSQFRCRNLNTLENPVRQCNNWGGGVHVCKHDRGGKQYYSNAFGSDHCADAVIPEDNFHSTSCASPIDRVTILNKVDEAIIRMRDNQDNITEPLSDAEKAFVMKFETLGFYRNTITTKILREYFTTCRLEYRYTIIIEPNLSGDHPFDEELTQMKINIYDATNAWYKPFIDIGLFPGHDHVDCICVEAVFKKDQQHRLASTEGVYLTDQGDNNSNSFDDNALWWKNKTETFKTFPEYESYIQTKCPEESFIACRDAHSMQEIVYHTSKYKEKSTAGSIHSENYPDNSSPRYERFFKNAILTRNTLSLFNHEFGHSLFGMRDSLSDYSATYDGRRYYKEDLQSIRPNTTCYGMGRGCLEIGKTDIHCAAICMLGILRHMKSQNGWIDGYMRR